jgi:hypothetical protein
MPAKDFGERDSRDMNLGANLVGNSQLGADPQVT